MSTFDLEPTTFVVKHTWQGEIHYQHVHQGNSGGSPWRYWGGTVNPSALIQFGPFTGGERIHLWPFEWVSTENMGGGVYKYTYRVRLTDGGTPALNEPTPFTFEVLGDAYGPDSFSQSVTFAVEIEVPVKMTGTLGQIEALETHCYCDLDDGNAIWCPYSTAKDPNWLPDPKLDIRYAFPEELPVVVTLTIGGNSAQTNLDLPVGSVSSIGIMGVEIPMPCAAGGNKQDFTPWGEAARVTMSREGCSALVQDNVSYAISDSDYYDPGYETIKIVDNNTLVVAVPTEGDHCYGCGWVNYIGAYESDLGAAVGYLDGHLIDGVDVIVPECVPVPYDADDVWIEDPITPPCPAVDHWNCLPPESGVPLGYTRITAGVGAKLAFGGYWMLDVGGNQFGPYKRLGVATFEEHSAIVDGVDGSYIRTLGPAYVEDPGAIGQPDFDSITPPTGCTETPYADLRMPIAIDSPATVIESALQVTCRSSAEIAAFAAGDETGWAKTGTFTWDNDDGHPRCLVGSAGAEIEIDLSTAPLMLGARFADVKIHSANASLLTVEIAGRTYSVTPHPTNHARIDLLGPSNFPASNPLTQSLIPIFLPERTAGDGSPNPPVVTDIPFDWGIYKPGTMKISGFVSGASYTIEGLDVVAVDAPYVLILPEPQWVGFEIDSARDPGSDPFAFQEAGVGGTTSAPETFYYQRGGYLIQDGAVAAEIVSVKHQYRDFTPVGWVVGKPVISGVCGAYELYAFPHHELPLHSVVASGSTAGGGMGSVDDVPLAYLSPGIYTPTAGVINIPACLRVAKVTFPANYAGFTPTFEKLYGGAALVRIPNTNIPLDVDVTEGSEGPYTAESDTHGTFLSLGNVTTTLTISQIDQTTQIVVNDDAAWTFDIDIRNRALSLATLGLPTPCIVPLYDEYIGTEACR
jgi:hypothetical protein